MQNSTRVDMYSWRPGHILRVDIVFFTCGKCTSNGISWIYRCIKKFRNFFTFTITRKNGCLSIYLSIYYDIPITRMLPGNHPSRQPTASLRSTWVTELAWHVKWFCYVRVEVAEAVKPQLPRIVSTALICKRMLGLSLFSSDSWPNHSIRFFNSILRFMYLSV